MEEYFVNLWSQHAADILWIAALVLLGPVVLRYIGRKIAHHADDGDNGVDSGREKRARTLANLVQGVGGVVIALVALVWILRIFGIDPFPVIASASVLGFAVGFGAQTLIKDFFAGALIFVENQFAVGDQVKIGTVEGVVCKMTVRITVVCDKDGNLVFIPNGSIANVVNYSLGERRKRKMGIQE